MDALAHSAKFLGSLLIPVSFEMIRKSRNGLYYGCAAVLAYVIGKEFVYDIFVEKQSLWHDSDDYWMYALGLAAAVVIVFTHRYHKKTMKHYEEVNAASLRDIKPSRPRQKRRKKVRH